MVTKILLKFSEKQVGQPLTSQVIIDLGIPLNILSANVSSNGGEILAEVQSKYTSHVTKAFEEKGVTVSIQKGVNIDGERCIHCGACFSICPVDAISRGVDYSIIFDEEKCIACSQCVDTCPTRAIKL